MLLARAIKFIRNSQSTIKIFLFSLILMLFSGTSDTHSGNDASDAQPDPKAKIIKQINDGLAQSLHCLLYTSDAADD